MANNVANILTLKGDSEDIDKVMSVLVDDDTKTITFTKFSEVPNELVNIRVPLKIVSEAEFKEQEEQIEKGTYKESRAISESYREYLMETYGTANWYDWCTTNWGTKWDAYDGYQIDQMNLWFNTAWATPLNAMMKLSRVFPNVEMFVEYADEDLGYNVGQYTLKGGSIKSKHVPKGGTKEAILMALEVQGDEYYLGEYIEHLDDDDIESARLNQDDFVAILLEIVVDKNIIEEDYPQHVQQYLLEHSVANELYEYSAKIKDLVK